MSIKSKKRVLIIDDSVLIRKILTDIINSSDHLEVVGTAADPIIARDKIKKLAPDVLTLDIEMPQMNGLQFLKNLMRLRPIPVVMVSTLTERGAPETLEALSIGAVDYIGKPKANSDAELKAFSDELIDKVLAASGARVLVNELLSTRQKKLPYERLKSENYRRIIAIGSSTGGTEAIKEILKTFPKDCPAILITQHMPKVFSASFADRLNRTMPMNVFEAEDGMKIEKGNVYIAPGDYHLTVDNVGTGYFCKLTQSDKVNRHRPSVDVMFSSIQEVYGGRVVAAILTGMGSDGAQSMLSLRQAGARTFVQNEATSVVWGMPQAAFNLGASDTQLPLQQMSEKMIKAAIN